MTQAYLLARSREMFEIGQQKFHAEEFLRTSNSQNETCIVYRTAMIGRFSWELSAKMDACLEADSLSRYKTLHGITCKICITTATNR